MFQTKFVEEIKIHISCSIFFSENRAVHEITRENMTRPHRTEMPI